MLISVHGQKIGSTLNEVGISTPKELGINKVQTLIDELPKDLNGTKTDTWEQFI